MYYISIDFSRCRLLRFKHQYNNTSSYGTAQAASHIAHPFTEGNDTCHKTCPLSPLQISTGCLLNFSSLHIIMYWHCRYYNLRSTLCIIRNSIPSEASIQDLANWKQSIPQKRITSGLLNVTVMSRDALMLRVHVNSIKAVTK